MKKYSSWEEKISVLLIEAMSEFATKSKIRPFGSDCSDVSKKYTLKFYSLLSQARKEGIEEIIEIIKSKSPSLVCPSDLPPFREDYINKWNLIDELKKKGKE